jgi:4-hydroxybenzoate polyprenyltransferase
LIRALRPKQWTKNLLLFAPLLFTVNEQWDPAQPGEFFGLLARTTIAFALFSLLSSAGYLLNDLLDLERDRFHPTKRLRPIAAGLVSRNVAVGTAVALALASVLAGFALGEGYGAVQLLYVALNTAYSFWLKHVLLVDVFVLAGGFVLRAVAGAVVIAVPISPWLYLCTMLGALFLALAKRRAEFRTLESEAADHRPVLERYTLPVLDQLLAVVTAATVIAYSLYTFTAENLPRNGAMMSTIPFVLFGLFRYLYLAQTRDAGGSPEDVLLKDKPLVVTILLWGLTALAVLWAFRGA